jgi:hypothetical protein
MGKFVISKTLIFRVANYGKNYPLLYITTPMAYTLFDLLDIIKMYAGYTGEYSFDFYLEYPETYFSKEYKKDELDNIIIDEFMGISPSMICSFGPLKIEVGKGSKSFKKWTKIYPEAFMGNGIFPEENEFKKLKDIPSKKLVENLRKIRTELALTYYTSPKIKKLNKEDFQE